MSNEKKTKATEAEVEQKDTNTEAPATEAPKAEEAQAAKVKKSDELVAYMAPLMPGSKQKDIFVAVNGETCVIKRGIPVQIKRKFYEALMHAQEQQVAAYKAMADLVKQGEKPAAEM